MILWVLVAILAVSAAISLVVRDVEAEGRGR